MDQPPDDPLLGALMLLLMFASVAVWLMFIARWRRGDALLEFAPRQPVPWRAPVALLVVIFVAIPLLAASEAEAGPPDHLDPQEIAQRLAGLILFEISIVAAVLFLVAVVYRANAQDFGLPRRAREFLGDVWLGGLACLAALAPVYGVQMLLLYLTGQQDEPPGHPLIRMVMDGEPDLTVVILVSVAAAVVAPVAEEIFFRLLLQGWLERLVAERSEWRANPTSPATASGGATIEVAARPQPALEQSLEVGPENPNAVDERRSSDIVALPYGWLPILVSSLLFAVAHVGYGPDPVAIFFLAIILGYVYQRTHRIVPCIVAHALFNSLAMLILWRMVFLNGQ